MQPIAHDPVKREAVTLGGKEYPLKFRLSDLSTLKKEHDIDLFVPTEVKGLEAVERLAIILAAGIAHTGEAALTPQQIMEHIELPELPVFALAIAQAQKKVSPESAKASKVLAEMAKESKPAVAKEPDKSVQ